MTFLSNDRMQMATSFVSRNQDQTMYIGLSNLYEENE